mmetsp:Transcript_12506/g.16828  ORF Transcript_12506/g.16828 Transcript_12506/m.16828 type:complete len:693 (+) Transcript_12506:2854-4932(+)
MASLVRVARRIASELRCEEDLLINALRLLTVEKKSVPFVARYRGEITGHLCPDSLRRVVHAWEEDERLLKRKQYVLSKVHIEKIRKAIEAAETLAQVEEIYEPYKSRKKTKADEAREQFPQAEDIAHDLCQGKSANPQGDLRVAVGLICAEIISKDAIEKVRKAVERAKLRVISAPEHHTYRNYERRISDIPHHAWLAIARDKSDLRLSFGGDEDVLRLLSIFYSNVPQEFLVDAWKRLLKSKVTKRIFDAKVSQAKEEAADCFANNIQKLLLTPPIRRFLVDESSTSNILAIDPGFRSGHKLAYLRLIDGTIIDTATIYDSQQIKIKNQQIAAVAVGDGQNTHGARRIIQQALPKIPIFVVREAGASVYSASVLAQEELPHIPVAHRGAVAIGRRLLDPLSEYVKVEPSSLGVGMYQKDALSHILEKRLDEVVEDIVAHVGVDVNTASPSLLCRVAGINKKTAEKLRANAPFQSRAQIQKKVFPKDTDTYQNIIGFLRIVDGIEPLDGTRIHPDDYKKARAVLTQAGVSNKYLCQLIKQGGGFDASINKRLSEFPALQDPELCGDPRHSIELLNRAEEVQIAKTRLDECQPGDIFKSAIVSNVCAFGAFIDCGLDKAGLLHISRYRGQSINNISVGATIDVRVESVDIERCRLGLSLHVDDQSSGNFSNNKRPRDESSYDDDKIKKQRHST